MSGDRWRYDPDKCDGDVCPCDCDNCDIDWDEDDEWEELRKEQNRE